ncbi:copper resistance CopC family protein [Jiangella asiatica]|uniref:copper resistance CopC family protein n=1 Tax=Jiangella asiatica TaxID=2530372 RepID=UPI0013A5D63C|nr:copper resistance CopC family protein [Jiangella asiatica]
MRRLAAIVGVAALAAAPAAGLTLVAAPPAAAHDVLVSSSPEEGAVVGTPLTAVELTFNNPVSTEFAQVTVLDAEEGEHQDGAPTVVGPTVTQAVHELPDGDYTIAYRIVSSDGHPISGTISFSVAAAAAEPPTTEPAAPTTGTGEPTPSTTTGDGEPTPSPTSGTVTPAGSSEDDGGLGSTTIVLVIVAAAAVVAVVAFLAAGGRRRGQPEDTGS